MLFCAIKPFFFKRHIVYQFFSDLLLSASDRGSLKALALYHFHI